MVYGNTEEKDMRWELEKTVTIAASHTLRYGECAKLHGHNWKIIARCSSDELNGDGMVVDFNSIKFVVSTFDHCHLNDHEMFTEDYPPTAENFARHICNATPNCDSVTVYEGENSKVTYYR